MDKHPLIETAAIILVTILLGVAAFSFLKLENTMLGAVDFNRIESSVTNSSSSVGTQNTAVLAAGAITSYGKLTNLGPAVVYCAVGATSSLQAGLTLVPIASTSGPNTHVFDSSNLIVQGLNCIASVTSTLTILAK